jgi:hypothetical protein
MPPGRRAALGVLFAGLARPAVAAPPREHLIGPGRPLRSLGAGVATARAGDTLRLEAGLYPDDIVELRRPLTIRAVGGLAQLVATAPPPNGKAILVVAADAWIEGLDLAGATSAEHNGAGIRYEGGRLALHRCRLRDNEMNLLAAAEGAGRIRITRCEFGATRPTAGLSHSLYANQVAELLVLDSLFHDAASGHLIKSRAYRTEIRGCRLREGRFAAAYAVDLPNGGEALIAECLIEQGPGTANPAMVNYGGESEPHPGSRLMLRGNVVVNRFPGETARLLRNRTALRAELAGNRVLGLAARQLADGPARVAGTSWLAEPPPEDRSLPWLGEG